MTADEPPQHTTLRMHPSRRHGLDRVPAPGRRRDRPPTWWRAHAPSDPHQFGRVDDDGTVWLISSAGERTIGSWQAGDPRSRVRLLRPSIRRT